MKDPTDAQHAFEDAAASQNLDRCFELLIAELDQRFGLEPLPIEPDLAEPRSFLRILRARHWNWQATGLRKVFGMRFSVRLPPLEQMNLIVYPDADREAPIFLLFCLLTRNKMIAHVNVNCPFDDSAYRERWVLPLERIRARYPDFNCEDRYPDWMRKWRTPAGVYGMFPKQRFDDFIGFGRECLLDWIERMQGSAPVRDTARREQIAARHAAFISDIRTQDKAQKMMARMIGRETARRIFHEVTT